MSEGVSIEQQHVRRRSRHRRERLFVTSPRFAAIDLGCALVAAALWYLSDGRLGALPLLVAGAPWMARMVSRRAPVGPTRFDIWMAAFLLTAAVGAWAGYNAEIAQAKFWLIVGAMVLFYALAAQPMINIWPVVYGLGAACVAVCLYFMLTNDWQLMPAKIDALNAPALRWMAFRPDLLEGVHSLHPNVAGGIMAMLFPFLAVSGLRALRRRHWIGATAILLAALLFSASLVLTSSRGAWLALTGGVAAWLLWAAAGRLSRRLYLSRRKTVGLLLVTAAGLILTAVLLVPGGPAGLLDRLPGPNNAGSRLEISHEAVDLITDFPFTGGGLGSFDGLYSQYIRGIPYHFMIHGHNLFLDLGVEQGLPGMLLFLSMLGVAFWWLADPRGSGARRSLSDRSLLCGALFSALTVLSIHGLAEDPLYGSRGVLLLFVPFGLVAAVFPRRGVALQTLRTIGRPWLVAGGLAALALVAFVVVDRARLAAAWQADRGALEMARVQLAGYPTNEWSDGREAAALGPAAARFERALIQDPNNRTALHRLGLLAMAQGDYETAAGRLASAHALDPGHRGIRKSLGLAYAWAGRPDDAAPLLASIPEASSELDTYIWWWSTQGRDDLSQRAEAARQALASMQALTP
jgi:O-antigen ligase